MKLNKKDYIVLFSIVFNENIEKFLLDNREKNNENFDFYILKNNTNKYSKNFDEFEYNSSQTVLDFFNKKIYNEIVFPKDYKLLFSLLKITQKNLKSEIKIKEFINHSIEILGKDIFLETILNYFKTDFISKNNIFSEIKLDVIPPYLILSAFEIIYENHSKIEKNVLENELKMLLTGRVDRINNLSFYKKLKFLDEYMNTSSFSKDFYEYKFNNKKLINQIDEFNTKFFYKKLDKELENSSKNYKTLKI